MLFRASLIVISLLLTGCGVGYAPVFDQSLGPQTRRLSSDEYRVQSGDTLAAIAFRFGMDYRELARINSIDNENRIFAGQIIRTKGDPRPVKSKSVSKAKVKKAVTQKTKPVVPTKISWQWPYSGKVLAKFSTKEAGNKGIDIAGKIGDSIKASAAGQVVYAGSGLLGYGNLVIIGHGEDYLSAYAHNSRILVKENQQIKAGQVIAELGNTGAAIPMLHFEIRKDGKPVDPLRYLPGR